MNIKVKQFVFDTQTNEVGEVISTHFYPTREEEQYCSIRFKSKNLWKPSHILRLATHEEINKFKQI